MATFQYARHFCFIFIYKTNKGCFFCCIFSNYCRILPYKSHTQTCIQARLFATAIDICTHTYTYMFSHVNPQRWQLTHSYHLLLLLFLLQPLVLQIIACAVRCQRSHCRLRHFAGSQMETTQSRTNDLMKLKCRYFLVDIYCLRSFHLFLLLFSG